MDESRRDAEEILGKCRESALRILEHRMHSEVELRRKLRKREFWHEFIDVVFAELRRSGLLDDQLFAETYVRQKFQGSRPVGRRRILQELNQRGIGNEMAQNAMAEVEGEMELNAEEAEFARALEAGRRKWNLLLKGEKDPHKRKQKLLRFLASRGFGGDSAYRVVEGLEETGGNEEDPGFY